MKKIVPISLAVLCLPLSAKAAENVYIPYVGADYAYSYAHADGAKLHYNGGSLNIGTKYNNYFGTELFYTQSASEHKKSEDGKLKTSYRAYGLDVAGYLPLGCYDMVNLVATGGIGEYVFDYRLKGDHKINDSGWGYRIGGGVVYNLTENVSLRALVRYVGLDKVSDVNHMIEYSTGLRYHF